MSQLITSPILHAIQQILDELHPDEIEITNEERLAEVASTMEDPQSENNTTITNNLSTTIYQCEAVERSIRCRKDNKEALEAWCLEHLDLTGKHRQASIISNIRKALVILRNTPYQ